MGIRPSGLESGEAILLRNTDCWVLAGDMVSVRGEVHDRHIPFFELFNYIRRFPEALNVVQKSISKKKRDCTSKNAISVHSSTPIVLIAVNTFRTQPA